MRRLCRLLLTVAVLWALPATAAFAVQPEKFTFRGETANATWQTEEMFVDVFLNRGTFSFGGEQFDNATVELFLFQATDTSFTVWSGWAELTPDQFELVASGGVFSAMVDVELELSGQECPFDGNGCADLGQLIVALQVNWDEARGRVFPSSFVGRSHSPFGFDMFMTKSMGRFTNANGQITGDLDLDLGSTSFAMISRNSDTSRFKLTIN